MKRINEYWEFITENKIELLLLESKLDMSDGFKSIVKDIMDNTDNLVAYIILSTDSLNIYNPLIDFNLKDNFIDVSDSSDKVTFTSDIKGQKSDNPYSENRNVIKIGRLVRKILDSIKNVKVVDGYIGTYTDMRKKLMIDKINKIKDSDIEEFVNKYKASYDSMKGAMGRFKVVSGNDIVKWYNQDNYDEIDGELGSSCMRYDECSEYIDFYADNDNIKLLILLNKDMDKIVGRALIWENVYIGNDRHISNDDMNKTFMDRTYTINDSDENLFEKYAKSKGWFYKIDQDSSNDTDILSPSGEINKTIAAKIESGDYDSYPYLDTLKYYYWEDGIISNKVISSISINSDYYIELVSTDGYFYCDKCDQSGSIDCSECGGNGTVDCMECNGGTNDCDECGGDGVKDIKCKDCDGTGVDCTECENGIISTDCGDCDGMGTVNCLECGGDGDIKCEVCHEGAVKCTRCGDPKDSGYW